MPPTPTDRHAAIDALRQSEWNSTGKLPPRYDRHGWQQSKAFLRWNRKMIRAGKTDVYADSSKLYNQNTDRFVNVQLDRRTKAHRYRGKHKKLFNAGSWSPCSRQSFLPHQSRKAFMNSTG